jgi:DNA-binding transcriptional regulator GbsR (MarR family)
MTERTKRADNQPPVAGRKPARAQHEPRGSDQHAPSAAQERFIEQLGLLLEETDRVPRIAGRIFGALLLSPQERSIDELAEQLAVSRASISIDARRLEQVGLLERITRKGDRRDYYRLSPDHYSHALELRLAAIRRYMALFADARLMEVDSPVVRERIEEVADAHVSLYDAITQELARWNARQRRGVRAHTHSTQRTAGI